MSSSTCKKTLLESGRKTLASVATLGRTADAIRSRKTSGHNPAKRLLPVLLFVVPLLLMPVSAVAGIITCYETGGQTFWSYTVTNKQCKDFEFKKGVECIDDLPPVKPDTSRVDTTRMTRLVVVNNYHPRLDGSTILLPLRGMLILAKRDGMLVVARKHKDTVEVADLPGETALFGTGDVFIGAVSRGSLIPLPPIEGLSRGEEREVAHSDMVLHFTVLDSGNPKVILSRRVVPVTLGSLAFRPIDSWRVEIEEGKSARSQLQINNRCSAPHLFSVRSQAKGLSFEQQTNKVLIGAGISNVIAALFNATGLKSKVYRGKVIIECLDCKTEPGCTQDRDELQVEMTVIKPKPTPSPNTNLTKRPGQ